MTNRLPVPAVDPWGHSRSVVWVIEVETSCLIAGSRVIGLEAQLLSSRCGAVHRPAERLARAIFMETCVTCRWRLPTITSHDRAELPADRHALREQADNSTRWISQSESASGIPLRRPQRSVFFSLSSSARTSWRRPDSCPRASGSSPSQNRDDHSTRRRRPCSQRLGAGGTSCTHTASMGRTRARAVGIPRQPPAPPAGIRIASRPGTIRPRATSERHLGHVISRHLMPEAVVGAPAGITRPRSPCDLAADDLTRRSSEAASSRSAVSHQPGTQPEADGELQRVDADLCQRLLAPAAGSEAVVEFLRNGQRRPARPTHPGEKVHQEERAALLGPMEQRNKSDRGVTSGALRWLRIWSAMSPPRSRLEVARVTRPRLRLPDRSSSAGICAQRRSPTVR